MHPPLTLLAGPSTSLRDDLVRCLVLRRPGLVAVAYDVSPVDGRVRLVRRVVDASGTVRREEVDLGGCCLTCTVREDAADVVALVAAADRWQEVLLALPAPVSPGALARALREDAGVEVDTVTTVVDALLLPSQLGGDDLLAERGLATAPTDRRSTAELVAQQLEEADVLVVADLHRVGTEQARTLEALLAHLAPLAVQVPLGPGGVGCDEAVSTGRHDGLTSAGDRRRLAVLAATTCPPSCGVTTLLWSSERPLHSPRLHAALPDLVRGVLRSSGHVWLADRARARFRWESAGGSLSLGDPARWDALPDSSLVLTGVGLDTAVLTARLDACLATEQELADGAVWPDPFEDALGPAHLHAPLG